MKVFAHGMAVACLRAYLVQTSCRYLHRIGVPACGIEVPAYCIAVPAHCTDRLTYVLHRVTVGDPRSAQGDQAAMQVGLLRPDLQRHVRHAEEHCPHDAHVQGPLNQLLENLQYTCGARHVQRLHTPPKQSRQNGLFSTVRVCRLVIVRVCRLVIVLWKNVYPLMPVGPGGVKALHVGHLYLCFALLYMHGWSCHSGGMSDGE